MLSKFSPDFHTRPGCDDLASQPSRSLLHRLEHVVWAAQALAVVEIEWTAAVSQLDLVIGVEPVQRLCPRASMARLLVDRLASMVGTDQHLGAPYPECA